MAKKKSNCLGRQLGWQICHRDTDDQPPGMPSYAVYGFNFVMTWLMNAHDRTAWRLCPVFEGDVDEVVVRFPTAPEALDAVAKYNKAAGR